MHDGTENGVLSLLEGKPESCWRLGVRPDVTPRDRVELLETYDFFTKAKASSRPNMAVLSSAGAAVVA